MTVIASESLDEREFQRDLDGLYTMAERLFTHINPQAAQRMADSVFRADLPQGTDG